MIGALGEFDAAVPHDGSFYHPLAGVYRTALASRIRTLVDSGELRPMFLIESIRTSAVGVDDLRGVDGALDSLRNLNTFAEYRDALREAGISGEPR
jgi:molybdopterin-guanine dinucleotide biosynthesis protein A